MEVPNTPKSGDNDRIEGDEIILFDNSEPAPRVLKKVRIITQNGEKRYKIRKTRNEGYLFN